MSPQLALFVCVFFILWLFGMERKRHGRGSVGSWIPVIWTVIIGSRPVSLWFGFGSPMQTTEDYLEGSPFDRMFFIILILMGLLVLTRRRVSWQSVITNNQWVFIYFIYLGISVFWSDYPFTSFKRWIKDFGNIVIVLIILTEIDPIQAFKSVLYKCCCLLISSSVLVIKYYPSVSRYYDQWTYMPSFCGVATDKNMLGMTLFVSGIFFFWRILELSSKEQMGRAGVKAELFAQLVLALMTVWLLFKAHSATAIVCTILGACILCGMRVSNIKIRARQIKVYGLAMIVFLLLINAMFNIKTLLVGILGRDATFTGRTDIWRILLDQKINPLLGVGYYSFWIGDRVQKISEGYAYDLNEAHNGYLETYLNSGLIGIVLLLLLLASAARRIEREIGDGSHYGLVRFAFFVPSIVYNMTEACFNKMGLVWFILLLVVFEFPRTARAAPENGQEPLPGNIIKPRNHGVLPGRQGALVVNWV